MNYNQMLAKLKERWQSLPRNRQILFSLAAAGLLAAVILLTVLVTRPVYAPLFTNLDPREAGNIANALQTMKVSYRVEDQGKTIAVPAGQVYDTRIQLASKGVLADAGPGFSIFDKQNFGMTDAQFQVEYQRALQDELQRTINSMSEVQGSRVHLVLPKDSVFLDNQVQPSASILLQLKPLAKLKPEEVQGVVDLVTGAVQGMKPENVHIVDTAGEVLTDNLAQSDAQLKLTRLSMDQYQMQRTYEKQLESRIQQLLTPVLGQGQAVAMVTASLNFDQSKTTSITYPNPGQKLSEQNVTESGSGTGAGGAPGTNSSQPGGTIPALTGGNSTYNKRQTTTNYDVGKQEQTLVPAPGNLRRLSVAVVVNGNYSAPQLQQIQSMVAAAVGLQPNRGDQINVSAMPFNLNQQPVTPQAPPFTPAALLKHWPLLAGAGVVLLGLVLALLLIRRRRAKAAAEEMMPEAAGAYAEGAPVPPVPAQPTRRQQVRDLARDKPAQVAEVLKLWLKE
ncbi:flagellar basal-body MS-ring/collar protein FliF [Desulfotomaculum copahuensis]|uniref:Flagellar M-ring protein n=1 Tax=Desulfotomaculum copahuensis TaxID=1838280 RepID=A0A1B7LBS2_9FIRM|nr:flagellar basal-body MS-ring/collar protein FliF [Desulfotomaculum copahuensis]OAT79934.1 flagellar M-ring protein FliF [Desulfotomaculum copahuensis]